MKKTMIIISALFLTLSAHAGGIKHVCKEITDYQKKSLVLTQVYDREIEEGVKEKFTLEVYNAYEKTPVLAVKGFVTTEDVMFFFESEDKKVAVRLYMDEMDQTTLSVKNKKDISFDCN